MGLTGRSKEFRRVLNGLGTIRRLISVVGAAPPISPVPISCDIRSPTAFVHGKRLATTSTRRSTLRSASRHISSSGCQCPFANGNGKPDGHFLRKLKPIAEKAGVEGAELHRYRKTYADTLHEEGVSVNTIRIRLDHESLDVTLAYLKGKDAESEEAQEHANNSGLALYA
jgi:integrase